MELRLFNLYCRKKLLEINKLEINKLEINKLEINKLFIK